MLKLMIEQPKIAHSRGHRLNSFSVLLGTKIHLTCILPSRGQTLFVIKKSIRLHVFVCID